MENFYVFLILLNFVSLKANDDVPESFDSRKKWPNCIPKIYDQGTCGACYAISTATVFSTRYCIKNNLTQIINFSPQNLVNCLSGCNGEFPDVTWNYINKSGITTDICLPYKKRENSCSNKCESKDNKLKLFHSGETIFLEDEISIKKEIMENGPVTSMMYLYQDYYSYKSGIYIHSDGENYFGFHAIAIVGWGVEKNVKYWIVQDSYGTSRGENGYMKIKIGDSSGAGATAFSAKIDEIYEEINEENNNYNITISIGKSNFLNNYLIFMFLFLI